MREPQPTMKMIPTVPYHRSDEYLRKELELKEWSQQRKEVVEPAIRTVVTARLMVGFHYMDCWKSRKIKAACLLSLILDKCEEKWKKREELSPGSFFSLQNCCCKTVDRHLSRRYQVSSSILSRINERIDENNYFLPFAELWSIVFGERDKGNQT